MLPGRFVFVGLLVVGDGDGQLVLVTEASTNPSHDCLSRQESAV